MRPSDYKTKQKEKILKFLNDNKDRHVTASEIIAYLSCGENSVGSATIYRSVSYTHLDVYKRQDFIIFKALVGQMVTHL